MCHFNSIFKNGVWNLSINFILLLISCFNPKNENRSILKIKFISCNMKMLTLNSPGQRDDYNSEILKLEVGDFDNSFHYTKFNIRFSCTSFHKSFVGFMYYSSGFCYPSMVWGLIYVVDDLCLAHSPLINFMWFLSVLWFISSNTFSSSRHSQTSL